MAKIPVYDAPDRQIRTEEKGFAAEETAGRRIGPAFDRAATDVRDIGNVSAAIFKQRLWPWDILELQQNNTGSGGSSRGRSGSGGSGGAKLEGPVNGLLNEQFGSGAVGRLGNVAAQMAQHFTGTSTRGGGGGRTLTDVDAMFKGGKSGVVNDERPLTAGNFPEKIGDPNATVWPRGRNEQPANPEFLRREAEQQVWRDPYELNPPPGYDSAGDYGGGYDAPPPGMGGGQHIEAPGMPETGATAPSSFPSRIWSGISDAASWLGQSLSSSDTPEESQ